MTPPSSKSKGFSKALFSFQKPLNSKISPTMLDTSRKKEEKPKEQEAQEELKDSSEIIDS